MRAWKCRTCERVFSETISRNTHMAKEGHKKTLSGKIHMCRGGKWTFVPQGESWTCPECGEVTQ